MPIYTFVCLECDSKFESIEKMDTTHTFCGDCGSVAERDGDIESTHFRLEGCADGWDKPCFGERKLDTSNQHGICAGSVRGF